MMANPTDLSAVLAADESLKTLILRALGSGEDGTACLLGLRKVSRGLKGLIDTPVIPPGRELMPRAVASFRQDGPPAVTWQQGMRNIFEKIQSFVDSPPPINVTRLAFQAEFPPECMTENERVLWSNFLGIWDSRLVWMSVDLLAFPLSEDEERVFDTMKTIEVGSLVFNPPYPVRHLKVPNIFNSAASVSIRMCVIPEEVLATLFNVLIENRNLQELKLGIGSLREVGMLLRLIRHKRTEVGFHLGIFLTWEPKEMDRLGYRLAAQIVASSSQIRLISVSPATMRWMLSHLSTQERLNLCAKVDSLRCWTRSGLTPLSDFTTLAVILGLDFKQQRLVEALPTSLRVLEVKVTKTTGISLLALPDRLLQLNLIIDEAVLQLGNLAVFVAAVAERCPRLESLGVYLKSLESVSNKHFRPPQVIRSLKHLEFLSSPTSAVMRKSVLKDVLHVQRLRNLETLSFCAFAQIGVELQTALELEATLVADIMAGEAGGSLLSVEIKIGRLNGADQMTTLDVYEPLVQLAKSNLRRRESSRMRQFIHPHFAAYCQDFVHPLRAPTGFY